MHKLYYVTINNKYDCLKYSDNSDGNQLKIQTLKTMVTTLFLTDFYKKGYLYFDYSDMKSNTGEATLI